MIDPQRAALLADLDALNERGLTRGLGPIRRDVDAEMIAAIQLIQAVGFRLRTADDIPRPFVVPTRLAWEIARALRGERPTPKPPQGFPVPS
jgi:hypothetical protein